MQFTPTDGLRNTDTYPTIPGSEANARDQIQGLLDQLRDYLNGGQFKFPVTQIPSTDPNTLDDYEEGSWTPSIVGSTVAGSPSYTTRVGSYVKIGKLVTAFFNIAITKDPSTSGNITIWGLPFTCRTANASAILSRTEGIVATAPYTNSISGMMGAGSAFIYLLQNSNGSWDTVYNTNLSTSVIIFGSITYLTD